METLFFSPNKTNPEFSKDFVLITGASKGIGKAAAGKFASEGYPLILCCLRHFSELCSYARTLCQTYSVPLLCFQTDVSDPDDVQQLFTELKKEHLSVSILVNNAGIAHISLLSDTSVEEWNRILSTNLSSAFYFSKQVIPDMVKKQYGKIINISSVWGTVGASCEVAYSASKGGINAFTKALAKELGPSNIQVNAIACGVIDTEMNHQLTQEDRDQLTEEIPSSRFGKPEEVAELIFSLATSHSYLTGQVITLDGGWT